jgi:hypothetical protein
MFKKPGVRIGCPRDTAGTSHAGAGTRRGLAEGGMSPAAQRHQTIEGRRGSRIDLEEGGRYLGIPRSRSCASVHDYPGNRVRYRLICVYGSPCELLQRIPIWHRPLALASRPIDPATCVRAQRPSRVEIACDVAQRIPMRILSRAAGVVMGRTSGLPGRRRSQIPVGRESRFEAVRSPHGGFPSLARPRCVHDGGKPPFLRGPHALDAAPARPTGRRAPSPRAQGKATIPRRAPTTRVALRRRPGTGPEPAPAPRLWTRPRSVRVTGRGRR